MKSWEALTEIGKVRRLRPLVADALDQYDLAASTFRLLEVATNIVFRVDAPDGGRYVMKVDVTDEHSHAHIDTAVEWLAALNRDTDIPVVEPVATRAGARYLLASAEGVPPDRRCVMYRWVPGVPVFDAPTVEHYRGIGELTARLHEHAIRHTGAGSTNRWDQVFYFHDDPSVLDDPRYTHPLTSRQLGLARECVEVVEPQLAALYDKPTRLIHADLHGWNINVHGGALTILDFDDVMQGQPVHDIAITFGYRDDDPDYSSWIEAYQAGYSSVAAWPVDDPRVIETLVVARRLMFANYVLKLDGDWSEMLARWTKSFEDYLR